MKIIIISLKRFSFSLLAASVNLAILAQTVNVKPQDNFEFIEGLLITTDREIYITGEQVWLKMYERNRLTGTPSGLSKIIYVELLDGSNDPVTQLKVRVEGSSGFGGFVLPDTLTSGKYLIRAYTRWMLNYPESLFSYKTISVINPYKNFRGLIRPEGTRSDIQYSSDIEVDTISAWSDKSHLDLSKFYINVKSDKTEYGCRSRVRLDISVSGAGIDNLNADMSLSVVKSCLSDSLKVTYGNASVKDLLKTSIRKDSLKLPEPEGQIISGTIRDKVTNEPLVNTDISFSVIGKSSICQFGKTNSKGKFMFLLKKVYGMSDIVIKPLYNNDSGCYVELDQPFCNTYSDLASEPLYIDSVKAGEINNAIISMQVNNLYASSGQEQEKKQTTDILPDFYDNPDRAVYLKDYIELTNIREVVKEILPEVMVKSKNNNTGLKVSYNNPFQKFENTALVLIDGVPVSNIGNLLELPSKNMERIDIINVRYFYLDYIFEGIVSFVTKKGNLSDLESDNLVFRQVLEGCQQPEDFCSPSYDADSLKNNHIPDFRNTLYWDPDIRTNSSGEKSVEFYTSDEPGEYIIIVEGITSDGKLLYTRGQFTIK